MSKIILYVGKGEKSISNTISILMSTNKNIFSKNRDLSILSSIKKNAITIPKISSQKTLIF